jgi:hypothetical protein
VTPAVVRRSDVDVIRRWLQPPVARTVIALIIVAQVMVVFGFSISYAKRGRRIADLEEALCRERLARFSHLASDVPCPNALHVLADALPQAWTSVGHPSLDGRAGARVVGWRPASSSRQERPTVLTGLRGPTAPAWRQ